MEDLGSLNPICLQPAHSESIGPVALMLTDANEAVGIWARHVAKLSSLVECPIQYKLTLFFFYFSVYIRIVFSAFIPYCTTGTKPVKRNQCLTLLFLLKL